MSATYAYHNRLEPAILRMPGLAVTITPRVEACAVCGATERLRMVYEVRLCLRHAAHADVQVERDRRAHELREAARQRQHVQVTLGWPPPPR